MYSLRQGRGICWIGRGAFDFILRTASSQHPAETGGVLLGYASGDDVVVMEAIGPGPAAVHGKTSFRPDCDYHEREIARAYSSSEGVMTYLGDWHSHPSGPLDLSAQDRKTLG